MSKIPEGRRNVALVVCIVLGLAVGLFIKRVSIGLLLGILLGVLVGGMLIGKKNNRMNKEDPEIIPVFKTWNTWYWLVIAVELAQIAIFWLLTKHFA